MQVTADIIATFRVSSQRYQLCPISFKYWPSIPRVSLSLNFVCLVCYQDYLDDYKVQLARKAYFEKLVPKPSPRHI
jgi:hypothetical protein